jgi:hypothetical protein
MTAKTKQCRQKSWGQEWLGMTAGKGQRGQKRTAGIGHPEGTGQPERDSRDNTARTGKRGQDRDGTEKLGRDNRGRIADSFTALAVTIFSK